MFEEVPSRRITERRKGLKEALWAALGIGAGTVEALRKGNADWETLGWVLVFVVGVWTYWKKRHEDPWSPPIEDVPDPHSGTTS